MQKERTHELKQGQLGTEVESAKFNILWITDGQYPVFLKLLEFTIVNKPIKTAMNFNT
jgi:hypothetical protein